MSPLALLPFLIAPAHAGVCEDLAEAVDRSRLEASLLSLAGGADVDPGDGPARLRSRHVEHPDHDRAQAWIVAAFAEAGLAAELEPFDVPGLPPTANVVAELPGAPGPVCVTAHYDSTGHAEAGWDPIEDPAPGADDDASGVAAVLEAARVLGGWAPGFERSLRFVAFDAEEEGLHGSLWHAAQLDADGVEVVLNLDPIGFNAGAANNLWATYDARWEEEAVAVEQAGEALSTPLSITTVDADLIGGDARSDHHPFWAAGWPAVHVSSFPQPPEYHTPDDTPDVVDLGFLHEAARVIVHRACTAAVPLPPGAEAPTDGAGCADCGGAVGGRAGTLLLALLVAGRRRRGE